MEEECLSTVETFIIRPVGYVSNDLTAMTFDPGEEDDPEIRKQRFQAHQAKIRNTISTITVLPEFEDLLSGLDAFSHVVILYWPHLLPQDRRLLKKIHPMGRKDIPLQGIFATRSPARPNPILISTVRLLGIRNRRIRVKGLESLDKSPVIDIKPVISIYDKNENPTFPDWIRMVQAELDSEA